MTKKIGSNSYHTLLQCTGLLSEIKIMNEFEHWKRKYTEQRGKQVKIKKNSRLWRRWTSESLSYMSFVILSDWNKYFPSLWLKYFQVNVGQDLLPSLLHTARCYKIKGLDNVQTPPGLLDHNVSFWFAVTGPEVGWFPQILIIGRYFQTFNGWCNLQVIV